MYDFDVRYIDVYKLVQADALSRSLVDGATDLYGEILRIHEKTRHRKKIHYWIERELGRKCFLKMIKRAIGACLLCARFDPKIVKSAKYVMVKEPDDRFA